MDEEPALDKDEVPVTEFTKKRNWYHYPYAPVPWEMAVAQADMSDDGARLLFRLSAVSPRDGEKVTLDLHREIRHEHYLEDLAGVFADAIGAIKRLELSPPTKKEEVSEVATKRKKTVKKKKFPGQAHEERRREEVLAKL